MSSSSQVSQFALPIIDLTDVNSTNTAAFANNLRQISRDSGFFYLRGHGFSAAELAEVQQLAHDFFALPAAEKQKIAMVNSAHFRGYNQVAAESTQQRPDYREQIDIGAELPALKLTEDSPNYYRLQGPNQWPAHWPEFQRKISAYQAKARKLTIELLRHFLAALEQPRDALDVLIDPDHPAELLKLIHYPASQDPTQAQGVGAHKDSGIITLLSQDPIGGLQVYGKAGWFDVPYVEDAFIVIIGEVFELASNGYLHGNIHRVNTPQAEQDRYSIAYFLTPNIFAGDIPLLDLKPELAALALGPDYEPHNPLYKNVGLNTLKGRLRSHLDVTERHYPKEYAQLKDKQRLSTETQRLSVY